ncbi:uncharacterized protein [Clytia hemisphaerica]|uniref:Uncharacterized protein n=1 Tax=Clytia hemisphaerica TaxID=252671 RepID=A0A7M5V3H8_9CNID|eukprot:TCONS_00064752-protein
MDESQIQPIQHRTTIKPKHDTYNDGLFGLGLLQFYIAVVLIVYGISAIAAFRTFADEMSKICLIFALWVIITGIISCLSAEYPTKKRLNQQNFGFNLLSISLCIALFAGFFAGIIGGIYDYTDCIRTLSDSCMKMRATVIATFSIVLVFCQFIIAHALCIICFTRDCNCQECLDDTKPPHLDLILKKKVNQILQSLHWRNNHSNRSNCDEMTEVGTSQPTQTDSQDRSRPS